MALEQLDQEVPLQEQQQEATFSQPNEQSSILSLTLDEFQCKSGKSFGSLNMDEFIASIWNTNEEPTTQNQNNSNKNVETTINSQHGTSFSVPPPICKKTVDEVWFEIHKNQPNFKENNLRRNETLNKKQTLGELTLEDFLVKAGVVVQQSSSLPFPNHSGNVSSNVRFLNGSYGFRPSMGFGFSTQCMTGNGLSTYQMMSRGNNLAAMDRAVKKCESFAESSGSSNRKRIIDGPPEVVVERRQRRMLKNRESAARSRARRQAYTVELEAELNLLKEENDKLKQILAEAERKRKQELLERKHSTKKVQKGTEKLRAIRRPISATW